MKALNQNFIIVAWLFIGELVMFAMTCFHLNLQSLIESLEMIWGISPFHQTLVGPYVFNETYARGHHAVMVFLLPVMVISFFLIPENRWWSNEKARNNMLALSSVGLVATGFLCLTPIHGSSKMLTLASYPYGFAVVSTSIPLLISHSIRSLGAYWRA